MEDNYISKKQELNDYIENLIEFYKTQPKTKAVVNFIKQLKQLKKFINEPIKKEN